MSLFTQSTGVARTLLILLALLFAQRSFALCSSSKATITMPAATYSGSADGLKPGTPLDGKWSDPAGANRFFELDTCASKVGAVAVTPAVQPVPNLTYNDGKADYPVYPTGVEGIGYVVTAAEQTYSTWYAMKPPKTELYRSGSDNWNWMGTYAKLMFVVTGRLKSGTYTIPAQKILDSNVYTLAGGTVVAPGSISLASTTITITATSCSLTTPVEQSVTLPAVGKSALAATGSRAGTVSFRIGLNCDANMKIYATMTDASTPTNTGDTLSLASGSTSTGVGVQVFRDGLSTPVSFGPDSTVLGNTNQWQVGSSTAATTYTIPFIATYVRTAGDVTPGSVQAKATITFSYQ